jgi:hypothetical protein
MRSLAVLRLTRGTDLSAVADQIEPEVRRLWQLYTAGTVLEANLTDDRAVVVLLLDVPDARAAERVLMSLPMLQHGLMTAEVHTLRPFRNWERLFAGRVDPAPSDTSDVDPGHP